MIVNGIIDIIKFSSLVSLWMFLFIFLFDLISSVILSVYKWVFSKGKFMWYHISALDRFKNYNKTYKNFSGLFKRIIKTCLRVAAFGFIFGFVISLYQYIVLKYDHKI